MTGPDPRVQHGDGPHPNREGLGELVADVQAQLDTLGVPRHHDGFSLTLLGRVSHYLASIGVPTPEREPEPDRPARLPVVGEVWGRGPRPSCGSTAQVCAWLRTEPSSPDHGVIVKGAESEPRGTVWITSVGRPGEVRAGYPAVRVWTMRDFLVEWWRP